MRKKYRYEDESNFFDKIWYKLPFIIFCALLIFFVAEAHCQNRNNLPRCIEQHYRIDTLVPEVSDNQIVIDYRYEDFIKSKGLKLPEGQEEVFLANITMRDHGDILLCIAIVESTLNPKAKNGNNYGLLQVSSIHLSSKEISRLQNHQWRKPITEVCEISDVSELFDVRKNICAGHYLFDTFYTEANGDVVKALLQYNANKSSKYDYTKKVLALYIDLISFRADVPRYDFDYNTIVD